MTFYFQTAYDEGSTVKQAWLRNQDQELQKQIVAYAEGFAGNPENVIKPKSKLKTTAEFLIKTIVITLSLFVILAVVRMQSSTPRPGTGGK